MFIFPTVCDWNKLLTDIHSAQNLEMFQENFVHIMAYSPTTTNFYILFVFILLATKTNLFKFCPFLTYITLCLKFPLSHTAYKHLVRVKALKLGTWNAPETWKPETLIPETTTTLVEEQYHGIPG